VTRRQTPQIEYLIAGGSFVRPLFDRCSRKRPFARVGHADQRPPGAQLPRCVAEHAHAELEIIRHQFVKGFASAPVNLALPLRMGSPWWRFCLREPAAGLVVAGGDLFDKIDNAAPQFWILDPREVSHERQSVGGREKVVDVCRAVFTRSRYAALVFRTTEWNAGFISKTISTSGCEALARKVSICCW
jgi:hypothetical protein